MSDTILRKPKLKFEEKFDVKFDPEGRGYDYKSALKAGLSPDKKRQWPNKDSGGMILMGRKNRSWDSIVKGEEKAGNEVYKKGGRYYSRKKAKK